MILYTIGNIDTEKTVRKALNKLILKHNNFALKGKSNEADRVRPSIVSFVKTHKLNVSGEGYINATQ